MKEKDISFPVHFQECHSCIISAEPRACLDAVQSLDRLDDPVIRLCLALRDLPGRVIKGRSAHRFSMKSFIPLGREGEMGVRYGLIGAFWRWDYGLRSDADNPEEFWRAQDSFCRLLLVFEAEPLIDGKTRLVTRTLVSCPDFLSRRKMMFYWYAIRPVSGLIRRRMLSGLSKIAASFAREAAKSGIRDDM